MTKALIIFLLTLLTFGCTRDKQNNKEEEVERTKQRLKEMGIDATDIRSPEKRKPLAIPAIILIVGLAIIFFNRKRLFGKNKLLCISITVFVEGFDAEGRIGRSVYRYKVE